MQVAPATIQDFARRYTNAWCRHDPEGVASFFAPHGSLTVNDGTPALGRPAIAAVAHSFMTAFPDLKVLMDDLVSHDGVIEYHWTLLGTNTGPGGGGKKVRITGYEAWQIGRDGLIAVSQGHFDKQEYQRQLKHGI